MNASSIFFAFYSADFCNVCLTQKYRLAKYLPDSSSEGRSTLISFIFLMLPLAYLPETAIHKFSGKKTDKKESGDVLSGLDGSSYVEFSLFEFICDATTWCRKRLM